MNKWLYVMIKSEKFENLSKEETLMDTNAKLKKCTSGQMNKWTVEQKDNWTNGQLNKWAIEQMGNWTNVQMKNGQMTNGQVDKWTIEQMDN